MDGSEARWVGRVGVTGILMLLAACAFAPEDRVNPFAGGGSSKSGSGEGGGSGAGGNPGNTATSVGSGDAGGGGADPCVPGDAPVDASCGIFMDPTYGSNISGDGSPEKPYQTWQYTLNQAPKDARIYMCVGEEKLGETSVEVSMSNKATIWGGLNCDWTAGPADARTTLTGAADVIPLHIHEGASGSALSHIQISAADASIAGGSSIGVIVENAQVDLVECDIAAGRGLSGDDGADGADGAGGLGGIGGTSAGPCTSPMGTEAPGPPGLTGSCSGITTFGGGGGASGNAGGVAYAKAGTVGSNSSGAFGIGGLGQTAVRGCTAGTAGGVGASGSPGMAGLGIGAVGLDGYTGTPGGAGSNGSPGGGGGGGGAALGKVNCGGGATQLGATGGAGATGGCGGEGAGGGTAGGSSIAVISLNATLTMTGGTLSSAAGGTGGAGGKGGVGGVGGASGMGGQGGTLNDACNGGAGGVGGPGGSGGGGQGGHSTCVAFIGAQPQIEGVTTNWASQPAAGGTASAALDGSAGLACKVISFEPGSPGCVVSL